MIAAAVSAGVAGALLAVLLGWYRRRLESAVPATAAVAAAGCLAAVAGGWWLGAGAVDLAWSAAWRLRLRLEIDGLSALYALLASGVGLLVVVYAGPYMRHHLESRRRPASDLVPFFAQLLVFLSAMVALAFARELYTLFLAWDLTAVTSALLIGTDRERPEARRAALTALVVTAGASLPFLAAIVLLHATYGTTRIDELIRVASPGPATSAAAWLTTLAALAKSAQVPLHFWLPRAMLAPTPVSAYLHSAAMVAAGVFLVSRLHPLLALGPGVMAALALAGGVSIAVGSFAALARDKIKEILAYSTVAQYGYVMVVLAASTPEGAKAAALYVLPHALAKSALFLVAGAVMQSAGGEDRISRLGGFAKTHPVLAAAAGVSAASLAGLPPLAGFFKDELFFGAVSGWHPGGAPLAAVAAALTLAYSWRFWRGIFLGPPSPAHRDVPVLMTAPIVVLAALSLAGGLAPGALEPLVVGAASQIHPGVTGLDLGYHLDARPENLMALGAWALAAALVRFRLGERPGFVRLFSGPGPGRLYRRTMQALRASARKLRQVESRDLRDRVGSVLVPGGLLIVAAVSTLPLTSILTAGHVARGDLTLLFLLLLVAFSALAAIRPREQLGLVLAVSMTSYATALTFAALGAPDVALVAVLVQTVLSVLFVVVLRLFPRPALSRAARAERTAPPWEWVVSGVSGMAAFVLVWVLLSSEPPPAVGARYLGLAREAHARDAVTAILSDFRGLDTMGEATVIAIALVAVVGLIDRAGRRR